MSRSDREQRGHPSCHPSHGRSRRKTQPAGPSSDSLETPKGCLTASCNLANFGGGEGDGEPVVEVPGPLRMSRLVLREAREQRAEPLLGMLRLVVGYEGCEGLAN